MAATDEKVQVSAPKIAAISSSKPVCRSACIVPQRRVDYPGTAAVANKKTNHESHEKEVSKSKGPVTATEAPPTAAVEDELGSRGEERVRGKGGARRKKLVSSQEAGCEMTEESIQCYCGSKQERGEMACCGICVQGGSN